MTWTTTDDGTQTATPSAAFWDAWRADKNAVKANGYKVTKLDNGSWQVTHKDPSPRVEASHALDSDIEVPAPRDLKYFNYQKAAIAFARDRDTLIAAPPGMGKSIMTAGVINLHPEYKRILVICPATIRINWRRELTKWLLHSYTIGVVDRDDYPDTDIIIINYDVADKHKEKLHSVEWDLLVLDESHALKNEKAKRTIAILGKGKKIPPIPAKHKLFLTGTPIMNRPIELFTTVHTLDPETWGSKWAFAHRYCDAKNNGWGWDFSGASNLDELNHKLRSTIMIRQAKEEALPELPKVSHQVVELPQTPLLRKLVQEEKSIWGSREDVLSELRAAVELAKVSETEDDYHAAVKNLRVAVNDSFAEMSKIRQEIAIAKLPYVIEHVKEAEDKVVVFFHHREVGRQLKEALGDEAVLLIGGMDMDSKQDAVDAFQNDPKVKYFLGSITAAGMGITLTASSHVVLAELDYRPAMVEQAIARCDRIGQMNNVLAQYLLVENSIDVKIAHTIIDKQTIINKAINAVVDDIALPEDTSVKVQRKEKVEPVSDEEKEELLRKLKILALLDYDGARIRNDVGFNKVDSRIGHSLASQNFLSDRQAHLARALVTKYRRQLEEDA